MRSPSEARKAAFTGRFRGDVEATVRGEAVFSERPGSDGDRVFGLRLDTGGVVGGVELSWAGSSGPAAGHLSVSTGPQVAGAVRARVYHGSAERPTTELAAEAGTLRIVEAAATGLSGTFTLAAVGQRGEGERPRLWLSGSFTATAPASNAHP